MNSYNYYKRRYRYGTFVGSELTNMKTEISWGVASGLCEQTGLERRAARGGDKGGPWPR